MAISQAEKGQRFEALHRRPGTFVIPNPWDAGSARILAALGYEALATTSAGFAFALGKRDGATSREELLARLYALARRPTLGASPTKLAASDLEMDLVARTVRRGGEAIDLQPREFRLLEYLMRNEGRVVTRKMLLEQVWEYNFDPKTNIVETHISRLRTKIDRGRTPALIQTVRGAGYVLRASA